MFKKFYPNEYVSSAYTIDYENWYKKGMRGIIFDIDNTLVKHNEKVTEESKKLINYLKEIGFKVILLSNNDMERVDSFAKELDIPYICNAKKPNPKNYLEAGYKLCIRRDKILFIGDQVLTDIYGARKAGIYSILTKPINKREPYFIVFKRFLEKIILYNYKNT